jgi:hypothetical protein
MIKTDENVEEVRILGSKDHYLGIRMILEELNMDKETVIQILMTNLTMKKVCAPMVPKDSPLFSQKTNTHAQTHSVLTRSCPV